MKSAPVIFLQLNEINFDYVKYYVGKYDDLPAFKCMLDTFAHFETHGEDSYDQLEPWIQWVSIQTGKTYAEHGVFRLGDIVKAGNDLTQIFEVLENKGLRVGAISPMNARNKLKRPAYFIPDPWTDTCSDRSGFSRRVTNMLKQTVNDNSTGRLTLQSFATLIESLVRGFKLLPISRILKDILDVRNKPWNKSLIFDQIINLIHIRLWNREQPDVSFVFMNAGAHIQHHYLFNAEAVEGELSNPDWYVRRSADPLRDMLKVYDRILGEYIKLQSRGVRIFIATGLSQVPYNRVKYYYRLKDHRTFLSVIGLDFIKVMPRMTRDFEICFDSATSAKESVTLLSSGVLERDGGQLFSEIELRDKSVFVTLTYPYEILVDDVALFQGNVRVEGFGNIVAFVAIKNGMHSTRGFAYLSPNISNVSIPKSAVHVTKLFDITLSLACE